MIPITLRVIFTISASPRSIPWTVSGKVQRLLNGPDVFVLISWKNRGRVANGYPADWYCFALVADDHDFLRALSPGTKQPVVIAHFQSAMGHL
jgi:hypothetical protein